MSSEEIFALIWVLMFFSFFILCFIAGGFEWRNRYKIVRLLNENRDDFPELSELVGKHKFWDFSGFALFAWYRFCIKKSCWEHSDDQYLLKLLSRQRIFAIIYSFSFISLFVLAFFLVIMMIIWGL